KPLGNRPVRLPGQVLHAALQEWEFTELQNQNPELPLYCQGFFDAITVGFPRKSKELGLPRRPDCVFFYAPLGHMVLFKGSRYFVLNLKTLHQEAYYPRRLTDWTGLPQGTNGALTRPDGRLYLFKYQRFWRFDPMKVRVTREGQWAKDLSWTGCSKIPQNNNIL
ncbi:hypothetical protein GOODEAATRI_007731, partial [Goodea atripinnis]